MSGRSPGPRVRSGTAGPEIAAPAGGAAAGTGNDGRGEDRDGGRPGLRNGGGRRGLRRRRERGYGRSGHGRRVRQRRGQWDRTHAERSLLADCPRRRSVRSRPAPRRRNAIPRRERPRLPTWTILRGAGPPDVLRDRVEPRRRRVVPRPRQGRRSIEAVELPHRAQRQRHGRGGGEEDRGDRQPSGNRRRQDPADAAPDGVPPGVARAPSRNSRGARASGLRTAGRWVCGRNGNSCARAGRSGSGRERSRKHCKRAAAGPDRRGRERGPGHLSGKARTRRPHPHRL